MYKILIVEDDINISEMVTDYLSGEGYEVLPVYTGESAISALEQESYDLALIDLMLPGCSGFDVVKSIRKKSVMPVIIITAKDNDIDKTRGLNLGADDYVTKPFSMVLLGKRITALLRRCGQMQSIDTITFGDVTVNFSGYTAHDKNGRIDITPKEIELLKLLIEHKGLVLTRSQILDELWGYDYPIIDRTIDSFIKNLRKKLRLYSFVTVKGIGYKYEVVE